MKNHIIILVFLFGAVHFSLQDEQNPKPPCHKAYPNVPIVTLEKHTIMDVCYSKISEQIHRELSASISYLAMGAHFSRAETFRPAVANFFLESASEEREHAKKMMEYMLHRGGEISNTARNLKSIEPVNYTWPDIKTAFEVALRLEQGVTTNIVDIIEACEKEYDIKNENGEVISKTKNDYHTVDHFIAEFLTEQYDGMRKLAGYIATLQNMKSHGNLAEVLYDIQFDQTK